MPRSLSVVSWRVLSSVRCAAPWGTAPASSTRFGPFRFQARRWIPVERRTCPRQAPTRRSTPSHWARATMSRIKDSKNKAHTTPIWPRTGQRNFNTTAKTDPRQKTRRNAQRKLRSPMPAKQTTTQKASQARGLPTGTIRLTGQ